MAKILGDYGGSWWTELINGINWYFIGMIINFFLQNFIKTDNICIDTYDRDLGLWIDKPKSKTKAFSPSPTLL